MICLRKFLVIPLWLTLIAMLIAMRNQLPPSPPEPLAMTNLGGYQLVTASSGSDTNTPKSLTANCPAGKVAIGGGAYISGTPEGVALTSSGPNDATPPTQWVVEAADTEGFSQNWELTGYVYCVNQSAPIANYQVATSSTASDISGSKTVTASCPGGTTLIGGGGRITGLVTNEGLTQSSPNSTSQPSQWLVAAHEIDPFLAGPWALHAYAFCAPTAYAGPVLASSTASTTTSKSITAICSPGGVLVGGGAQVTGEAGQQALIASRPGGGWVVEAHQVLSSAPAQNWGLRSYAFCVYHTYLPDIVK